MIKKFLTLKEAAGYLGISDSDFQNIIDKGEISSYKIGGIYTRYKSDDLDSYRSKSGRWTRYERITNLSDKIKDFFYFNDFYIISCAAIVLILYLIFKQ